MGTLASALTIAFYTAMLLALAFFVHKVFWFIQFRKLQSRLVSRALDRLTERTETTLLRFDRGADSTWELAAGTSGTSSPVEYVRSVEARLEGLLKDLERSHRPIRSTLVEMLSGQKPPPAGFPTTVLEIPRLDAPPVEIALPRDLPRLDPPRPPDPALFVLKVRSRYGIFRRLMVFFIGAVDVVYSSAHVARMSQNDAVPTSLLLRRMTLVFVILGAIVVDIALRARVRLVEWAEETIAPILEISDPGSLGELWNESAATSIGLSIWLAGYGAIYLSLFVFLRKRSADHLKALEKLQEESEARLEAIVRRHRQELLAWADEYAHTLDDAAIIAVRQVDMLVQRTIDRLRRRLASDQILAQAEIIANLLFEQLPESSRQLADPATEHPHTFRHYLWPREEEMQYQVKLAQYRAAWRDIEVATNALRGHRPDPKVAGALWRKLVAFTRMFKEIIPEDVAKALPEAYAASVEQVVDHTERELKELDGRLTEIAEGLRKSFAAAGPLIESRVELAEENVEADVARFVTEILRIREQARLEAMAFEI